MKSNRNGDTSCGVNLCTISEIVFFGNRHRRDLSFCAPHNSQCIDADTDATNNTMTTAMTTHYITNQYIPTSTDTHHHTSFDHHKPRTTNQEPQTNNHTTLHATRHHRHAPRATRHAPRATRHAPRATRHTPHTTHHTTHHTPHTTHHTPHTTHHTHHTPHTTHHTPHTTHHTPHTTHHTPHTHHTHGHPTRHATPRHATPPTTYHNMANGAPLTHLNASKHVSGIPRLLFRASFSPLALRAQRESLLNQ